jgi:hypothetical protein
LDGSTLALTATISDSNANWLSQRSLVFVITDAQGVWTWPILELQITDGALRARLGPRESSSGYNRQAQTHQAVAV